MDTFSRKAGGRRRGASSWAGRSSGAASAAATPAATSRMATATTRTSPAAGIQLVDVHKAYGKVQAVRGVDLAIGSGETVALLGPNGAGKSTTIDMVLGLALPDAGHVSVFGVAPTEAVQAGQVGGMLQTGQLIENLTVRELVHMVSSLYPNPRPVDEVLALTDTTDLARRDTNKLSGGQTQRVRFALALVGDPDLLVLDEPTAALDVEGRRDFWDVVRGVAQGGKTVVFATHYLEEADAYADRIVLLAQGKVVADGPANVIRARVGGRTIRAALPGVALAELEGLAGVTSVDRRGDAVVLVCDDSDAALRALLARYPAARDVEVRSAGLEEAFLELTATDGSKDGSRAGSKDGSKDGSRGEGARP